MALKVKTFDFGLVIMPIIFLAVGISVIYSLLAGTANDGLALKQGIIALIGFAILFSVAFSDYRLYKGISWLTYLVSIILLVIVNYLGKTTNGATNWLDLKFFQLQPSEVAKIFLIISLASYFSSRVGKIKWSNILVSLLIVAPPLALVLKEPDLGSAIVICVVYLVLLLISKPTVVQVISIFSVILLAIGILVLSYSNIKPFGSLLHDYQRGRIEVFLHPDSDPLKTGYNVKQAQITIGSGGIIGKGLGKGSQSQLQFLPEPHTDFIFAGIAESFGFIGSFILLILYCFFLLRLSDIAALARDNFGLIMVFGILAMFFVQLLINVGMDLGLLPVTGIPLPFLSYGGTSLLVSLFAVGLAESVYIRHKKITF